MANRVRTVLASAARTATVNSPDFRNASSKGARVHIDVTAVTATPSVVFTIQGKDNLTGDYYTLLASAAVTATGDTYLVVYPGVAAAANTAVSLPLSPYWRVNCVHGDADSITYGVTVELLD